MSFLDPSATATPASIVPFNLHFLAILVALSALVGLTACAPPTEESEARDLDAIAEDYVRLALAAGRADPDFVDAYYGPEEWKVELEAAAEPALEELIGRARALAAEVAAVELPGGADELTVLRRDYLAGQLRAAETRLRMVAGERWSFDEESQRLFDAVAPSRTREDFEEALADMDRALAAEGHTDGTLIERLESYLEDFVIPPDRIEVVFDRAIEECRIRTGKYLELPDHESFVVEQVVDKPWSGYNWYQGDAHSLIQVNVELPIYVDRAVDLACHEGYPGHHVYNLLLEEHLAKGAGFVEFTIYPLFSPQSLIAEGTANLGIELAFPGDERMVFERDELYPLIGIDPARAEKYREILAIKDRLDYAGNEAARGYLDGTLSRDEAVAWLTDYNLSTRDRAEQRIDFYDKYRAYVINYNLGKDLVREWLDREAGVEDHDARWAKFGELLASPRLPSGLRP